MNEDAKDKIRQNFTALRDGLIDLDPVIDYLIQEKVFDWSYRDNIPSGQTEHKIYYAFMKHLTSSHHPKAFDTFVNALYTLAGYETLAQKLNSTKPIKGKKNTT